MKTADIRLRGELSLSGVDPLCAALAKAGLLDKM
jgi:hypothetical protein